MALSDLSDRYPGRAATPDADYPQGRIQNETTPGADDGTPLEEAWLNDWQGFFAALLAAGSVTPSGDPDTATASQYLSAMREAVREILRADSIGFVVGPSTTQFEGAFSVAAEDTAPRDVAFSSDGTRMFVLGDLFNEVHPYTLSTAWDVTTASYDGVSLEIGAQDTVPRGLSFSSDGTKMYIVGQVTDTVYQYTLSTAWGLLTASYGGVSLSVGAQDTQPDGLTFKPDGTKMYLVGDDNDSIFQYTLSTAWDLSTASYDGVGFSVAAEETAPRDVAFSSDGTRMFVLGDLFNSVYQYGVPTAWDLSSVVYDQNKFLMREQEFIPLGLTFKPDGTKMYVVGDTNDSILQYGTGFVRAPL